MFSSAESFAIDLRISTPFCVPNVSDGFCSAKSKMRLTKSTFFSDVGGGRRRHDLAK
jgi:hypothetical protein